uniref:Uncharacterized protein n=1 Tax=Amphimedon queenslandica TaxID=400682 RepID=A0A1X7VI63_AMPQE
MKVETWVYEELSKGYKLHEQTYNKFRLIIIVRLMTSV